MTKTSPSPDKISRSPVYFIMLPILAAAGAFLIYLTPAWISFNGYCFICISMIIVEAVFNNRFTRVVEIVESVPHREMLASPEDYRPVPESPAPDAHMRNPGGPLVDEIAIQRWTSDFSINVDDCAHCKLISLK